MAFEQSFKAIGTKWHIFVEDAPDKSEQKKISEGIDTLINTFDKKYSRFRSDSLVTEMSAKGGVYAVDEEFYKLLNFYEQLYRCSDGKVTPLIGQALSDAGYDSDYSFKPGKLSPPPAWDDVIDYDENSLKLKRPALLDFGAAGKGYLVDLVGKHLENSGIQNYVINAGGDIKHRNSRGTMLEVGLENPKDFTQAIGITKITNQSICASATSRRVWSGFNHLIDPASLLSPTEILSTWVIADTTMQADGIATALFFKDPAKFKSFRFNYVILYKDMSLVHTKDMAIKIFEKA